MAEIGVQAASDEGGAKPLGPIVGPQGWKRRLEDPFNTYYRYPVALWIVRLLVHTPITPNQVSLVQPILAATSGWLISSGDPTRMMLAVAAFEIRSILDCVDGSLARAKRMSSPNGHAIDAMADWLGVVFLYIGLTMHFRTFPPSSAYGFLGGGAASIWTTVLVLAVSGFQAGMRSFAFDYFKNKYLSIYERGVDETIEGLRTKVLAQRANPTFFGAIDVFIGRMGHLAFEREWFNPDTSRAQLSRSEIDAMAREQDSPRARFIGVLWSLSGGDAYLSFVMVSLVVGRFLGVSEVWDAQVFFATFGLMWIVAVIAYNRHFIRTSRRAYQAVAA
ncbi:MAG: CDP-alcohol phosphatidyltransferase family protein [Polyangiaceae bacterium]